VFALSGETQPRAAVGAAALVATQLAAALGEHQDGVGGGTQRVGDVVAVLE
jgi:hypothetical protein